MCDISSFRSGEVHQLFHFLDYLAITRRTKVNLRIIIVVFIIAVGWGERG